jgi:AcrR family transcriptional regulator
VTRQYQLKKRAEAQQRTRERIVDAAIELHGTIGPVQTTITAIAERAGVQRHTVYSHFPTEREIAMACSGTYNERNPLPDPDALAQAGDGEARLRRGVDALYHYYERHEGLLANVARDAEVDELTREVVELRTAPTMERYVEVILKPFATRGARRERLRAALVVALDFRTWQTLVRRCGLGHARAVEAAVAMVRGQ